MGRLQHLRMGMPLIIVLILVHLTEQAVVETEPCGRIKGALTTMPNGKVHEFIDLPYAVPPVEELRWTHSQLLSPSTCWKKAYDATPATRSSQPKKCPQGYYTPGYCNASDPYCGTEDCLYLSVRSPDLDPAEPLPVLVWIHGGSLKWFHSNEEGYAPDAEFTADLGVVTVNVNYRLDVFGFFSSPEIWRENPKNRGNFGIGDVITALKWVRQNIRKFGGNPGSITLLGESSGGTVILGLLASDLSDGLFHNAVVLSAAPVWKATPWIAHKRRETFVTSVGCAEGDDEARLYCLKTKDKLTLLKSNGDNRRGSSFYDMPFTNYGILGESMDMNVMDGFIIKKPRRNQIPFDIYMRSRSTPVKVFIGNTAQETGYNALRYGKNKFSTWKEAGKTLKKDLLDLSRKRNKVSLDEKNLKRILEMYNFGEDSPDWWPQIFFDTITTDIRTTCINNDLVQDLNRHDAITAYRLYISSRPDWENKDHTHWSAVHGWDSEALFDYKFYNNSFHLPPSLLTAPNQERLKTNIREVVRDICFDRISGSWGVGATLVLGNGHPGLKVTEEQPQRSQCTFWGRQHMTDFGWQN